MSKFTIGQRIRHIKNGQVYTITDTPELTLMKVPKGPWVRAYIYHDTQKTFVRLASEVEDGRFESVEDQ